MRYGEVSQESPGNRSKERVWKKQRSERAKSKCKDFCKDWKVMERGKKGKIKCEG